MDAAVTDELLILDLLARGAPLEELLDRLDAARRTADPADHAQLDALADATREVFRAREEDRRHLHALSVLNATTADLAAQLDLDSLLQVICDRARTLLGTDAAYVTLVDEGAGDTYVRATAGVVSAGFRAMRLGLGVGLGGLVAKSGISVATSDYSADERFAHSSGVDELVVAEGLRAIVGVPLRRGDEVLGVLLSGSRNTRPFAPADVALFEALATHAAIAIENARLFQESRESVLALRRASSELRQRNDDAQRAAALHARLAGLVAEGASPEELLDDLRMHVGGRVELVDEGSPDPAQDAPGAEAIDVPVAVAIGADRVAYLRWWPPDASGDRDFERELLERSGVILAGVLLARRARSDADHRRRAALITALLDAGDPDVPLISRLAARIGLPLDRPCVVLVVDHDPQPGRWAALRVAGEAARERGAAGEVDGRMVVVVPGTDAAVAADRWESLLTGAHQASPVIGVSEPAIGVADLRRAYGDAGNVLGLHHALGHRSGALRVGDLGLFALVFGPGPPDALVTYVDRVLGPVLEHDQGPAGPTLLPTLEAYVEEQGHLANTGRRLGVHVNTVYQRLARVDALLGTGWRTPDGRLELHVAVRAHAISAAGSTPG